MTLYDSGVPYQRLIGVSGNIQRYRMMRYVMVLGIILVTIFLYVSYYTTPMSSVDNRFGAYVSQEQRLPPIQGSGDQNFFSIPAEGNSSGGGVAKDTPLQPSQLEESSGPSEETKKSGDSSSSSSNSNRGNDGGSARAETGAGGLEPALKEQANRQVNANHTAGKKPIVDGIFSRGNFFSSLQVWSNAQRPTRRL